MAHKFQTTLASAVLFLSISRCFGGESPSDAPANSWIEIPNTKMKKVAPGENKFPGTWGICGPSSVISAWSGAALDTKRSRLILFGGGHADYAGNEVYAFDINQMSWERMTDPTPNPKADDSDENPDGTPQSRHSYGGLAYLACSDRFFALGGSIYQSGHGACNKVWTFDLTAKKWTRAKDKPPFGAGYDCTCAYDPMTKKVWYCNYNMGCWAEIWCYECETEKWTRYKHGEDPGFAGVTLDTRRGLLVALSGGKVKAYDVRGKAAPQVWQTTGGEEFLKCHEVGFDYDPVADKYAGWCADKVFVLDPEKKEWTVNNPSGAPKPSGNGTFGRWRYVPSVNAFVLVTGLDANVHFYKLSAGPGKQPDSATISSPSDSTGSPAPAPKIVATMAPPKPARDLEAQRTALRAILQKAGASSEAKANITLFGKTEGVSFAGADESSVKLSMDGNTLPLPWKDVRDADLAQLAIACKPDDSEALFNAGAVTFTIHNEKLYNSIMTKLLKVDSDRATSLRNWCDGK